MSEMSRERFDELKESYALGALPEDELREFEAYLATHTERQAEVDELTSIVSLLAVSPTDHEPPDSLRRSVMAIVNAEAGERSSTSSWRTSLDALRRFFPARVVVGAAAALVVALLSWNVFLQSEVQDLNGQNSDLQAQISEARDGSNAGSRILAMQGEGQMISTKAEVMAFEDDKAVLVAEDLPSISEGQTFQIWVISGEDVQPSGLFQGNGSPVAAVVRSSLHDADVVAVTVEPAGGSPQPTTDPMLTTEV